MDGAMFLTWVKGIMQEASNVGTFLLTPIEIGTWHVAPIGLITIGGLIAFISIAIVCWILSSSPV